MPHASTPSVAGSTVRGLKDLTRLVQRAPGFPELLQPVPRPEVLGRLSRVVSVGDVVPVEELTAWLLQRRMTRAEVVEVPGEFSLRGGILDVFPTDSPDPVRIEFFGDE